MRRGIARGVGLVGARPAAALHLPGGWRRLRARRPTHDRSTAEPDTRCGATRLYVPAFPRSTPSSPRTARRRPSHGPAPADHRPRSGRRTAAARRSSLFVLRCPCVTCPLVPVAHHGSVRLDTARVSAHHDGHPVAAAQPASLVALPSARAGPLRRSPARRLGPCGERSLRSTRSPRRCHGLPHRETPLRPRTARR